jgi:hypothetical protein
VNATAKYWIRKSHRWLSLLIGIQVLFWMLSGFYFALIPIESIRGEDRVSEREPENFAHTPLASPQLAIAQLLKRSGASLQVRKLQLRRVLEVPVYEISYDLGGESHSVLADARDGQLLAPVDREQATAIAEQDFAPNAAVLSVDYVENVGVDDEYRSGPLPAWRVGFDDDDSTRLYVSAELARVTARRNTSWRIFDFLWMLHIMDFDARDNFNTLLLQVFAALGLIIVISGFILWGITTSLFRSRQD